MTMNEERKGKTMTSIRMIEGIGEVYSAKLKQFGINTTQAMLERANSAKDRKEVAEKTGISETLILEWVNLADLFRIKGVGEEYSDLLEEAGVDTVPELARRDPENLYGKIVEVNQAKKLVRKLPTQVQVSSWIEQAKAL